MHIPLEVWMDNHLETLGQGKIFRLGMAFLQNIWSIPGMKPYNMEK
jgi:hypothetical protein